MTPNTPHGRTGTETEIKTDDADETTSGNEGRNATGKYEKRDARTTTGTATVTGTGAERSETVPDEAGPPPASPPAEPTGRTAPDRPTEPERPATAATPAAPATPAGDGGLSERMEHAVGGFVDDPRGAVREAETVLDEAAQRLTRMLEQRRESLRASVHGVSEPDTEELRIALTHYRDMTRKLLDFA
ncbi:hypothetical protein [Streptomyces sp. NBC_00448]|uniref:hypothetical protein n=1 Tax=Streptomyces sp. NBC_00448 TaxID=2903652 RepID=UPI002E1C544B